MTLEKTRRVTPLAAVLLAVLIVLLTAGTRASGASGPNTHVKSSPASPMNETAAAWTVGEDPAPVVTIEGAPRIESYHEYHYFGFSADVTASSFFCSLDEEPFAPCVSGGYRHVPYGQHLFRVYAVSPGGVRGEAAWVEYESRDPNWD